MNYDVIIIGTGIVGLATALKILEAKPDLLTEVSQHDWSNGVVECCF